ncbi:MULTISPECIES: ABC transporter permease [Paraburkholderia]|jgi:NitT/TauT family transport system permease protein|uniref:ABC transporter permease n=1 Tax=Paraburkholderia TaxID=1822464 RepID=UPI00224F0558|nr:MULTISPECIES: ABC transporter permease [Paraburkholderia]MCX4166240.1 ABC transporter permease [Paraburkholderia megapolitana]MDN7161730.1 ABC transporter permease [Paraburkholderia sp. CHISQ3]MDQ6498778.1 ABC transporter permease [Paraburkholderia megapolitana]
MRLINRHPSRSGALMLLLLPFVLLIAVYFTGSALRLQANPDDKLLPGATQMGTAIHEFAFTEDKRTGEYLLWQDTVSSMRRLAIGLVASAALALVFGIFTGTLPLAGATLTPFITVISMIPPLAVLPILFIVFGLDELSKVVLIVIGITPMMIRDLQQRTREIPEELWVKAQTLGATSWTLILRVIVPQLLPRLLVAVRLALCSAWLFLIAAEAIASTDGLGYRIFLVRRYLAMDVILPYVMWITLLAWLIDEALRRVTQWAFPWYGEAR